MARHPRRTLRPLTVLRLLLGAVAGVAAAVALVAPAEHPPPATTADGAVPVVAAPAAVARAAAPVRVQAPAVGIDSSLDRLGLDSSGALVPPADVTQAGWFAAGPAPGDVGPAVIAGHVDSFRGPAGFFRLDELAAGDEVLVGRADGTTARFTVTRVARYPKTAFPTAEVYGPTPDPQLRLITCGGAFDRGARSYVDNVVVYARQTP